VVFLIVWNLHTVTETFLKLCFMLSDAYVTYIKIFYSMSVFIWKPSEVFRCQYFLISMTLMTCVAACCFVVPPAASSGPLPWQVAKKCYSVAMPELFLWFTKLAKNVLFLYCDASESPSMMYFYIAVQSWLTESQPSEKQKNSLLMCVVHSLTIHEELGF
jgi:hypothetical protein